MQEKVTASTRAMGNMRMKSKYVPKNLPASPSIALAAAVPCRVFVTVVHRQRLDHSVHFITRTSFVFF